MNDPIIPEDPSRVTKDNPYGFTGKAKPGDIADWGEPATEEEWLAIMAEPPGPDLRILVDELLAELDSGVVR